MQASRTGIPIDECVVVCAIPVPRRPQQMDVVRPSSGYQLVTTPIEYGPIKAQSNPLGAWKTHAFGRGDLPSEYITPRAVCSASEKEFEFITRGPTMAKDQIQSEINRLAPWTYHVDVNGATTLGRGTYNDRTIRFHRYRANLIAATVARMLGRDLSTSTVLDLGCNCGFFTLELAVRGAQRVLGLDFRQENLDQAEFLKRAFSVRNAEFLKQNVKDLVVTGAKFDVVLNLGLMYHLSTPYEVMRACYDVTKQFCVIDTITHTEPFSGYHVLVKNTASPIEGDLSFELQPTYRGILDTTSAAGFRDIIEIVAPVDDIDSYSSGSRRCFVAFKDQADIYLARLTG